MKTYPILLLVSFLVLSAFFNSCDQVKIDVNFDMQVSDIKFVIDTTSLTGVITLGSTTFHSDLQQTLDNNNVSMDDIESIKLTSAEFRMTNPGAQNFDIVDKAYAYLSAGTLSEIRIASKDPVPNGVTNFLMDTNDSDLKPYLKETTVSFRAEGYTNAPNTEKDSVQAFLTFNIKASKKP